MSPNTTIFLFDDVANKSSAFLTDSGLALYVSSISTESRIHLDCFCLIIESKLFLSLVENISSEFLTIYETA